MSVNDGLTILGQRFPMKLRCGGIDVVETAKRLMRLAAAYPTNSRTLIRAVDDLGLWVRPDGEVCVR
jgi:hypothetical protein